MKVRALQIEELLRSAMSARSLSSRLFARALFHCLGVCAATLILGVEFETATGGNVYQILYVGAQGTATHCVHFSDCLRNL